MIIILKKPHSFIEVRNCLYINAVLISAFLLGGCNTKEPVAMPTDNPDYSIINGDTVKTVVNYDKTLKGKFYYDSALMTVGDTIVTYKEPQLHTAPTKDPDLSKIKNNTHPDLKGKPLQMIAIGGSLSAGVRDGGYFNEGMLTSYPNLVARQMKLKKFELPLFSTQEYSGTIRRTKTSFNPTGGPFPKYNIVKNNSGVTKIGNNITTKKYIGDADNMAVPYFDRHALKGWANFGNSEQNDVFGRLAIDDKNKKINDKISAKKFDFFILETGFDDVFQSNISYTDDYTFKDDLSYEEQIRISPELDLIRKVVLPMNAKGVLLNVPDLLDLPYYIKSDVVKKYVQNDPYLKDTYETKVFPFEDIATFLPTSVIDSLLSPKVHINLKPNLSKLKIGRDYYSKPYGFNNLTIGIKLLNSQVQNLSKRYGYPIVDIQALYKKIANEGYLTDDDVRATVDNFYSSNRINPSAFGQSVIANEVLKVINLAYKTNIPLIATKEYLNIK